MIDKVKDECTGCNACYSKCPVAAIRMQPDREGFLRPVIDMEICIRCEQCEAVCPALVPCKILPTRPPRVFAAWTRNEELRINSTSGGVFSELANHILENGGHVVAARYKPDHSVEHVRIDESKDLPLLRQSKYVQSEMGHTDREIKALLETGDPVLFCGAPCQAAGLLSYLGRAPENLTVCDFICCGVTSPLVYQMYLADLEKQHGAEIETVHFKNKNVGWNQFCTFIRFKNGKTYQKDREQDPYMYGYLTSNLYHRPCCYACKFKEVPGISDISLGDFWGIGRTRPHLDQNKGTSLVLLNTEKGARLFAAIQNRLVAEECRLDEALGGNPRIYKSVAKPENRGSFFDRLLSSGSFLDTMRKFRKSGIRAAIREKARIVVDRIRRRPGTQRPLGES